MKYSHFLTKLRDFAAEADNIDVISDSKTLTHSFAESDVTIIPDPFVELLKIVILLLQRAITEDDDNDKLCDQNKEVIVLVALRMPSVAFMPIDGLPHFCFILSYFKCSKNQYHHNDINYASLSAVVIDFTTGQVLSDSEYINASIEKKISSTACFGLIAQRNLETAWEMCQVQRRKCQTLIDFNERGYLSTYYFYKRQSMQLPLTEKLFENLHFSAGQYYPVHSPKRRSKPQFNVYRKKEDEVVAARENVSYQFFPRRRHISFGELPEGKYQCTHRSSDDNKEELEACFQRLSLNP